MIYTTGEAPAILLVGAGPFQLPAISKLHDLGYKVAAVDGNPSAIGLSVADYPFPVDFRDVEQCIDISRSLGVVAAMTVASDIGVRTVGAINDALGTPGPTAAMALVATNKMLMRECFAASGVPSAISRRACGPDEALAIAEEIGFPVVLKPADSAGSRGVSLVETRATLDAAYHAALKHSMRQIVLVEEFLEGQEVSVEAFVFQKKLHVLALSDKIRTDPPHLLDTKVVFPCSATASVQSSIVAVAEKAVAAMQIDMAPIHMELILTGRGPRVVEVAARGAGFHVFTTMLPWVTGVDVLEQLIRVSTGKRPDLTVKTNRAAMLAFPTFPPGIVEEVTGVEAVKRLPGVEDIEVYVKVGQLVRPLTSGSDRVAHIIVLGDSRQEVESVTATAIGMINIRTRATEMEKPLALQ